MKKYVRYCDDLLIAGLLLFYYEDARSFRRYLIALVDAMTHNPHNLSASLQNGNVSFAVERDLQINEEIADLFFRVHSQRNEIISCLPSPPQQRKRDPVCIQLCNRRVLYQFEIALRNFFDHQHA